MWAQKSGEIFYRAGRQICVVRTRTEKRFEFDTPQVLFQLPFAAAENANQRTFDVSPDGTRILAVTIPEESRPRQIDLLLEWVATLARQNR